jgi:putative ABC transport system permease protein
MDMFGVLLRLYPARFRARFAAGMRHAFECEHRSARARGRAALGLFWIRAIAGAIRFAIAEHRAQRRELARVAPGGGSAMRSWLAVDWRDAWRSLKAAPLVHAVAVVSLALGIGANTALFSILNALLYKPLPVHEPSRLAVIDRGLWTNPIWEQVREHQHEIAAGAFAWAGEQFDLSSSGEIDPVDGIYASGSFFGVLGVSPVRGRLLTEADDRRGLAGGAVAVVSYGFWQRRLGGAEDVIGRSLAINRVPFTIVGVTPSGFFGPDVGRSADITLPLAAAAGMLGQSRILDNRHTWWLEIGLRLRPEQTLDDATQRLRQLQPAIRAATLPDWPTQQQNRYLSEPMLLARGGTGLSELRPVYERPLNALLVIVGVVLLIACGNIVNLLLARAVARRHELSVRLALGASRLRVSRQLLTEALMLTAAGVIFGLIFAEWASRALLRQLALGNSPIVLDVSLDWRVLGFTSIVAAVTAVVFGLAPAIGVTSLAPNDALRDHGRLSSGRRGSAFRNTLVVAQVALSLALVVAAGLFTRTLVALYSRDVGFDRKGVLVLEAKLQRSAVPSKARLDLLDRLHVAAQQTPGVAHAALSFTTPVSNRGWNMPIAVAGSTLTARERMAWVNAVTPDWFDTYGVRLMAGRDFDTRDRIGAPTVAVVNRTFASRLLATDNPIGKHFAIDTPQPMTYEIVGVVEDTVYRTMRSAMSPAMYIPVGQWQEPRNAVSMAVRAAGGDPLALATALTASLERVEPTISVSFHSLEEHVNVSLKRERLVATLSGFFGVLALVLAGLGLYGIAAYAVNRRRMEIGIRMALGASASQVMRMVLTRLGWLVAAGLVVGAALSIWSGRFVATLLFGLEARDVPTLAGAMVLLSGVAMLAGWLPARRASRIDPTVVLRDG